VRQINDAHAHLFSRAYYAGLLKQQTGAEPSESELREALSKVGIDLPAQDPAEHAARWIKEMDWHGVGRMVLFTSLPGEQAAVSAAVKAFPNRFVGFTMVNPLSSRAFETAQRDLTELGLRGIELFPSMFRFSPADEKRVYPFYELALKFSVPVFCHVGILRVKLREALGLPSKFDISLSNPLLLHRAAADFPGLKFVIPHLGCGFLREAAFLGHQCPNVYVDTSSSNTWLKLLPESPTLARALEVCLEAFGPDRVLFGTDSCTFPRGYRSDILHALTTAFNELQLEASVREKILSDNFRHIMG
jgi:predicted TIM-barrel fold metal-dependent hydrolase